MLQLHEFLSKNREMLIARCQSKVATRPAPRESVRELYYGVPLFLDQLITALRLERSSGWPQTGRAPLRPVEASSASDLARTAVQHGNELLRTGFTVGQVVHDYGDLCQAITDAAIEEDAPISVAEFRTLNRCLDDAIADAVTEFGRQRDELHEEAANGRLGEFAHELRNLIGNATLAVAAIKTGSVGLTGATGALLDRSLARLAALVDRTLVDVRLNAGVPAHPAWVRVADLIAEVQVTATIEATARGLEFTVAPIEGSLAVDGDLPILASALANILQNAVKFTRSPGHVSLRAHAAADRVLIEVEDECGGLPEGMAREIFRPFEQLGADRTGLGLGLSISRRGVEANGGLLQVRNLPGVGCVFTIDLPRAVKLTADFPRTVKPTA